MKKIVLFHPTLLPPRDYGGVERVVLWLAKGLVELGHDVSVGAYAGSELPRGAKLIEIARDRTSALDLLPLLPPGTDLVHFMAPPGEESLRKLPCASVLTVHGNGKPGESFPKNTVFLSGDHARRHGASEFVFNGIDPDEFIFDPKRKSMTSPFLFLSKTSWKVKNLAGAMDFSAGARAPLWISGGNRPWSLRAKAWLRSRWPGSAEQNWQGPVAGRRKAELLAGARALVFPVLWNEPFGLVVAESLMSGTPVLASNLGSLPELVPPDVGMTLDPTDRGSWIEWMSRDRLPWEPERCRQWALENFHYRKMAESYLRIYSRVCGGDVLHQSHPKTRESYQRTL